MCDSVLGSEHGLSQRAHSCAAAPGQPLPRAPLKPPPHALPCSITNAAVETRCQAKWGIKPRWDWIAQQYGVRAATLTGGSNIVYSNGAYDPWSSGGVGNITGSTLAYWQRRATELAGSASGASRAALDSAIQHLQAALASAQEAGVTVGTSTQGASSVWIADGAHHVDLFFADPADPPSITSARQVELALIKVWVAEFYAQQRPLKMEL